MGHSSIGTDHRLGCRQFHARRLGPAGDLDLQLNVSISIWCSVAPIQARYKSHTHRISAEDPTISKYLDTNDRLRVVSPSAT